MRETRWPAFSETAVVITPIRSMLCVPLFTHHHGRTALSMCADQPSAFGPRTAFGGVEHTDSLIVKGLVTVGDQIDVWVDDKGAPVRPPSALQIRD